MTETTGTTATTGTTDPSWLRRHSVVSIRTRIVLTILVLTTLAMAGAGVIVYTLESARIEAAVAAQIEQEVLELRTFQQENPVDPDTLEPITDPNKLLEVFLTRNVPDDDEMLVWYAGSRLRDSSSPGQEDDQDLRTRNRYGEEILVLPAYRDAVGSMLDRGGTQVLEDTPFGEVWVTSVPVQRQRSGDVEGTLVIINFLLDEHEELNSTLRTYATVSVLFLGVLLLIAAWQSGRLLAPLRTMRTTTEEISETDLARRLPETGNDDLTALTRTLNGMLARLEAAFRGQRRFLDDAGHELKTPLTIMRGHLELLDAGDPDEITETRDLLLDEVDRMSRLVGDLIVLAKAQRPDFLGSSRVDLDELTRSALAKARGLGERRWELDATSDHTAYVDEQRITQALLALAENAVKHTGPDDVIAFGSTTTPEGTALWVRDTGPGVPPEDREMVLQRFGRSHVPDGDEGFGLGLSIVSAIAEAHGGSVRIDDAAEHGAPPGAMVVVSLPPDVVTRETKESR